MIKKISILFILIFLLGCSSSDPKKNEREEYFLIRGLNYSKENNLIGALGEYEKALDENSKNIITLKEIAKVYARLEEYDLSIKYYKKALDIDKKDIDSLKGISVVNYLSGETGKALSYIKDIPTNALEPEIKKYRAYLLYEKKDYKKSIKEFEEIFENSKEFDKVYSRIYLELLSKNKKNENLRIFLEENKEKFKDNREYLLFYFDSIGEYFGEYEKIEKEIKREIAEKGGDDELYLALTKVIYSQHEYAKAKYSFKLISDKERYKKNYLELKVILKGEL